MKRGSFRPSFVSCAPFVPVEPFVFLIYRRYRCILFLSGLHQNDFIPKPWSL